MSAQYQLLPDTVNPVAPVVKLGFKIFALVTVLLPMLAFVLCIVTSLHLHFERSTATHCHVANYLPSISAAIGGFEPQRYIWRTFIALHSAPRFLVGLMYHSYFKMYIRQSKAYETVIRLALALYVAENASLIGLSYVSSIENKEFHEVCFTVFTICSILHMCISISLFKALSNLDEELVEWSIKCKVTLATVNIASLICALYFYFRHNHYCEPFIYTFFALCEYVFVISNMGFHLTAYYDFHNYEFAVSPIPFRKVR